MNGETTSGAIEGKKIRDFIALQPYEGVYSLEGLSPENLIQSYIFTEESTQNFKEIFAELGKPAGSDRRSVILSGDRGVGKTYSLAIVRELIRDPSLARLIQSPMLQVIVNRLAKKKCFVVEIHCFPHQEETLKELFYAAFNAAYLRKTGQELPPKENWLELEDSDQQLRSICDSLPPEHELVILLDDISEKLITYRNMTKIISDLEFLQSVAVATSRLPVFLITTFFENLLSPPDYNDRYRDLHQKIVDQQLLPAMLIKHITKKNLLELINRNIIVKNDAQKQQILQIYQYLSRNVLFFKHDPQFFLDVYPIHPMAFSVSFYLHRYIKNFSLIPFIYSTANKILSYRCTALATIDLIFDSLGHELKKVPDLQVALQSYETVLKDAVSQLPVSDRLLGRLILKAVFVFSVTEEYPPTIENIINALLLSDYQSKPITPPDVGKILDFFEARTPQCLHKIPKGDQVEYQLVTIDHVPLNSVIDEIMAGDAALAEKTHRLLFQAFFQQVDGLNIVRENYINPVSNTPLECNWRGTSRKGVACWAERYQKIHLAQLESRANSLIHDYAEQADKIQLEDIFNLGRSAPGSETPLESSYIPKNYDWQLFILEPSGEHFDLPGIRELTQRYPFLLVLQPGALTPEESQRLAQVAVLLAEENRFRFLDYHEEFEMRRRAAEGEIFELIRRKYFVEGILYYHRTSHCLADGEFGPENFLGLVQQKLIGLFEAFFPLHPVFDVPAQTFCNRRLAAEFFLQKSSDKPELLELTTRLLVPLQLVRRAEEGPRFEPETDAFLESPFISEILFLIGSFPRKVFPLPIFYQSYGVSPYGLQAPVIDIILIALVAAGKIKIFQSQKADLEVINRMSLSGEFDLGFFDSVQAIEDKVLPLPELMQWGFFLCDTRMETGGGITQSRKHLKGLLQEWLDFERENSLDALIQKIPNDLITTHLWREMQSCHRNAKAIENVVDNICNQHYNLEDGLALLAKTFSNNLKAFQCVLGEIHNIREFLEWVPSFLADKQYVLTSEKTDDQVIEGLRYDLSTFFERSTRLIEMERRTLFQKKIQQFKEAYSRHYTEQHNLQHLGLTTQGKLAELIQTGWWKNLPKLSRITLMNQFYLKTLYRLLTQLQERECNYQVEQILEHHPRCLCGFRLNSGTNVENLILRITQTAEKVRNEYLEFFGLYRKVIIRELQKIPSLDDEIARQVVSFINGNLDGTLSLDSIKLINFVLKRKVRVVPLATLTGDAPTRALPRDEFLQVLSKTFKDAEESRDLYFIINGEEQ